MNTNKKPLESLTWTAPSHIQSPRSAGWYLIFGLVSLGLIIFGIYNHSILMVITFIVVIFSVLLFTSQQPRALTFRATTTGIASGSLVYPYKTIKTFWIIYNPPSIKTLNFETSAYLNNQISLELGNQNPIEVKLFLSQYIPEDLNREETFTDTLARRLKI
ncbi:MAG: hypothetical protein ABI643_02075 [Candidatus Doudnabacteria bacterium]